LLLVSLQTTPISLPNHKQQINVNNENMGVVKYEPGATERKSYYKHATIQGSREAQVEELSKSSLLFIQQTAVSTGVALLKEEQLKNVPTIARLDIAAVALSGHKLH
jgi:Ulp1 family protease